jgi:hypothetical protein
VIYFTQSTGRPIALSVTMSTAFFALFLVLTSTSTSTSSSSVYSLSDEAHMQIWNSVCEKGRLPEEQTAHHGCQPDLPHSP